VKDYATWLFNTLKLKDFTYLAHSKDKEELARKPGTDMVARNGEVLKPI
jgi:hypothetical protein